MQTITHLCTSVDRHKALVIFKPGLLPSADNSHAARSMLSARGIISSCGITSKMLNATHKLNRRDAKGERVEMDKKKERKKERKGRET